MNRRINEPWEVSAEKHPPTMDGCVAWLKDFLSQVQSPPAEGGPPEPLIGLLRQMIKENPEEWWLGHHFGWGMSMRNAMRANGYGEKELGVHNLDDHYIPLIERACLED